MIATVTATDIASWTALGIAVIGALGTLTTAFLAYLSKTLAQAAQIKADAANIGAKVAEAKADANTTAIATASVNTSAAIADLRGTADTHDHALTMLALSQPPPDASPPAVPADVKPKPLAPTSTWQVTTAIPDGTSIVTPPATTSGTAPANTVRSGAAPAPKTGEPRIKL